MREMATTGATTTYTYAETSSTNPSAPTAIGGGSLTYDTNGNLTAYNATKYTWDYRNRMSSTGNGSATTTYTYDHTFESEKVWETFARGCRYFELNIIQPEQPL